MAKIAIKARIAKNDFRGAAGFPGLPEAPGYPENPGNPEYPAGRANFFLSGAR
ncbi:MAG: hypothetical protein HUK13_01020 [Muribaculaceae bacterium]|nr:hypothetical protein [Muribaculaceae bacterium]